MKVMAALLTACVVLAAAQAVAVVLCLLLIAGVGYGFMTAPRETVGLVGLLCACGLVQAQPLACLGIVALLVTAKLASRA